MTKFRARSAIHDLPTADHLASRSARLSSDFLHVQHAVESF
jgi:hypothetical protein